jgi:hypothetical protein
MKILHLIQKILSGVFLIIASMYMLKIINPTSYFLANGPGRIVLPVSGNIVNQAL